RPARRQPVRRRAQAGGDRPRAGRQAAPDPARRAVRRRRPDLGQRDPAHRPPPQAARHRRTDHRPQRARDPGHLRPRLHPRRRRGAGTGHPRRAAGEPGRAPGLPGRRCPPVSASSGGFLPPSGDMLGPMKPRLSPALQQHLVLTPQLRQAIRLLQLSAAELEAELAEAVASSPLPDWAEEAGAGDAGEHAPDEPETAPEAALAPEPDERWDREAEPWQERIGPSSDGIDDIDHPAAEETLQDHLLWQLHLGHFSQRDARIGIALIDAIDDDGYLREDLDALAASLKPDIDAAPDEMLQVLHRIQQFDP